MIYEPLKGTNFRQAVRDLKELLTYEEKSYETLRFNDIDVTVSVDSNEDDIAVIYELKRQLNK